jgi:broad specificity phosphatase PhoE
MITRIIGVRHSTPDDDAVEGLRLILGAGEEKAIALAKVLATQLVGQKAIVLCSHRLEAYMTALIIASLCGKLTIITHPDLFDPYSCKPTSEASGFIINEAEKHEATTVIIVQHGGQIEGTCADVVHELTHKHHFFSWELEAMDFAEAVILNLENKGVWISYLNSPE